MTPELGDSMGPRRERCESSNIGGAVILSRHIPDITYPQEVARGRTCCGWGLQSSTMSLTIFARTALWSHVSQKTRGS